MAKQNYVGLVRTKPLLQELLKSSAGGMAAASGAILALWLNSDRVVSAPGLIGLALLALSIPLLVVGRYMADVFNAFELITRKADALLESLYTAGLGTALVGYFLVLQAFSKLVAFSLLAGVLVAGYAIWALDKALDSEVIKRRDD